MHGANGIIKRLRSERDMKIAFMATGIERRSRAAMIEESKAGNEKTKTTGS